MAIALVGTSGAGVDTGNLAVILPGGISFGDAAGIVVICSNGQTLPTPAGWSLRAGWPKDGGNARFYLYTKNAVTASDSGATVSFVPSANNKLVGVCFVLHSGNGFPADWTDQLNFTAHGSTGTSYTAPASISTQAGDWGVAIFGARGTSPSNWTPAGGLVERQDLVRTGSGATTLQLCDAGGSIGGSGTTWGPFTETNVSTSAGGGITWLVKENTSSGGIVPASYSRLVGFFIGDGEAAMLTDGTVPANRYAHIVVHWNVTSPGVLAAIRSVHPSAKILAYQNLGAMIAGPHTNNRPTTLVTQEEATAHGAGADSWFLHTESPASATISTSTNATPPVFTTSAAHGLTTSDYVEISGHSVSAYNGIWAVASVPLTTTFTCVGMTAAGAGTGGTAKKVVTFDDFTYLQAAHIGRASFRTQAASHLAQIKADGFDGIMVDDCNMRPGHGFSEGEANDSTEFASDVAYRDAVTGAMASLKVAAAAQGLLWVPNVGIDPWTVNEYTGYTTMLTAGSVDGIVREFWTNWGEAAAFYDGATWSDTMKMLTDAEANGKFFAASNYPLATPTTTASIRYGLASFYLHWNGVAASGFGYDKGRPSTAFGEYRAALGTPLEAKQLIAGTATDGAWMRHYTGGVAVVNARSAGGNVTFTLGATYIDAAGASVTQVILAPSAGAVLTAPEPSAPGTSYPVLGQWREHGNAWRTDMNAGESVYGPFGGHWAQYYASGALPVAADVEQAFRDGKDIHIFWKAWDTSWGDTAAGGYDTEVNAVAADVVALCAGTGRKLWLTLHHEPEDDYIAHGSGGAGWTAANYRGMWSRVRARFDAGGASQYVTWVMVWQNSHSHPPEMLTLWGNDGVMDGLVDIVSQQDYIPAGTPPATIATKWLEDLEYLKTNDSTGRHWSYVHKPQAFTEWGADLGGVVGTNTHRAQTIDAIRGILPDLAARNVVELRYFDARSDVISDPPSIDGVAFQNLKDASEAGQSSGGVTGALAALANDGATATTATIGFTLPAGWQQGDNAVVWLSTNSQPNVSAVPAGWILDEGPVNNSTVQRGWRYHKVLQAGEPNPTWTIDQSVRPCGVMVLLRGAGALHTSGALTATASATSHSAAALVTTATSYVLSVWLTRWADASANGGVDYATVPTGTAPSGPPGAWALTYSEDFTAALDQTNRWYVTDGWTGQNNVTTRAVNVTVTSGELRLRLSSTTEGASILSDPLFLPAGAPGIPVRVGDYVEARCYFPGADGVDPYYNWSAFWIVADPWPSHGEHDIAEILGSIPNISELTVNYQSPSGGHNQGAVAGDWNNAFHTYGVHRKAGSADVYWDGVLVKSYVTDDDGGPEYPRFTVGKDTGRTPQTGATGELRVDWLKVWAPATGLFTQDASASVNSGANPGAGGLVAHLTANPVGPGTYGPYTATVPVAATGLTQQLAFLSAGTTQTITLVDSAIGVDTLAVVGGTTAKTLTDSGVGADALSVSVTGATPQVITPNVRVEVAFATAPMSTSPIWTDITSFCQAPITITRGRGDEFSAVDPSTMALRINNADGRFTMGRTASPYYPNVKIGRRIRVTVTYQAVPYVRFDGHVNEWPTDWPVGGGYAWCDLTATDRLKRFGSIGTLRSMLEEETLRDSPTAYYPLSEDENSTSAGSITPSPQASARVQSFGTGGGVVSFGQGTGPGTDEQSAPIFNPLGQTGGEYLVAEPVAIGSASSCWQSVWFTTTSSPSPNAMAACALTTSGADAFLLGIWLTGEVQVFCFANGEGVYSNISPKRYNDGHTHHALASLTRSGSTVTVKLYVDGALVHTGSYIGDPLPTWRRVDLGACHVGFTGSANANFAPFSGTLSHHASGTTVPSAARIAAHYQAGATGLVGERTDVRIGRVADWIGIPLSDRALDVGDKQMGPQSTAGAQPLDVMREAEAVEQGVLFCSGPGKLTFHRRSRRYNRATPDVTLDAAATEVLLGTSYPGNDAGMVNDMEATRTGGARQRAINQASIDDYGLYRDAIEVPAATDADALAVAAWRVGNYGDPLPRLPSLTVSLSKLHVDGKTTKVTALLLADISSLVRLDNLPTQAPATSDDQVIEGWTEVLDLGGWVMVFNTSPNSVNRVWQLQVAGFSELGVTTRLGL